MSTLGQLRRKVKRLARDDSPNGILADPDDYNLAIVRALQTYSLLRPKCLVQDLNVGSDYTILTSALTGFDVAYIEKLTIEYPVLQTYGKPNLLDRDMWFLYQSPSGPAIRFNYSPQQSQNVRITHATPHVLTVDDDGVYDDAEVLTVTASDEDALASEAAANACEMLSVYYTQSTDSNTGADFVGFQTKGGEYGKRATMLHGAFTSYMENSLGMNKGSFKVVRG